MFRKKFKFSVNRMIDIDFETRSEVDISVGPRKYAEHPSTEILMMSYSINGNVNKVKNWNPFTSKRDQPYLVIALAKAGYLLRAFNSEFEYWIWNIVGTRQFGWPELPVEQFYDVMAMSTAMAFPANLKGSGEAVRASIQKNEEGKSLINFFSKPSRKKDEHFKNPHNYPDKFKKFIDYCDDDVASQISIANKTQLLSGFEHDTYLLTEKMNARGIPVDEEMVRGALDLIDQYQVYANKRAIKIAGEDCPFESLTQTAMVKKWLNDNGCAIPGLAKEVIAEWVDRKDISKKCRKIIQLRFQSAKSSTSKYKKILEQLADDGRIHGTLKYHIARTGRWGGRGVQIQNFPRPHKMFGKDTNWDEIADLIRNRDFKRIKKKYGDVMEVLSSALRSALMAPKGYKLVSADYSQIEARFVMWFAEDKQGLKEFGGEGKIYEGMASQIYSIPKQKIGKDSFERFMGKQTILGAGFGMGAQKFVSSCKEKGGVEVEFSLAKKSIDGYRSRYPEVKKLWTEVEKAAIQAVKRKGFPFTYKKVTYVMRGHHLYCKLPSGRELCYPFAFLKVVNTRFGVQEKLFYEGINSYTNKWTVLDTWGGKLTENFVQAAARDVMAHGLMNCEKKGYFSLFTVHDEGVSLVRDGYGSYKDYEKLMCKLPRWARSCPIEAEGWEGNRYRK